jgi:carbon-monoxide dehydrogenase large subunit
MFVLRSPHAAASFQIRDVEAARRLPGVRLILTGHDPAVRDLGTFTSRVKRKTPDGKPNFEPPYRVISRNQAKFAGDVVAAVFADTLVQAEDAAEAIEIEWDPLPAVTETRVAIDPGSPVVWDEAPNNICFLHGAGDADAVDRAINASAHTITLSYPINRIVAAPIEARGALASYDQGDERFTLHCGVQNPHYIREELAERILGISGNRLRVVSPDTGGAFGLKEAPFPEYALALVGARIIGQPVLWLCTRSESFLADHHARDNYTTATLALDAEGNFTALRVDTVANIGAYISFNGLHSPANNLGGLSGVYRTPHIHARIIGAFTHTPPTSPYRGAGRPEAIFAVERLIDVAAQRLGMDRVELRRRNLIPSSAMPYDTGFLYVYDSGDFERNMLDALEISEWADFPRRRADALGRGRLAGIGLANAIEIAAGPVGAPWTESAEIRFDTTGSVTVSLGIHSQGQGHAITFAQIVADMLGLQPEEVQVRYGDTDQIGFGTGSFGSRSAVAGSVVLRRVADQVIARGRVIAAAHLEAAETDMVFSEGKFVVAGTDREVSLSQVARLSYTLRPETIGGTAGLSEQAVVAPSAPTFPNGCHVCEVEIDPDTGRYEITRYSIVDDVGRLINPMLAKGQIHGGLVQGIGQILGEDIRYDAEGQLLTGSFMDYQMPRASDLPEFLVKSNEVLTPTNPLGVKGVGEAGTVGALAAVVNALVDAVRQNGVDHIDMPATPSQVWKALRARESARM